MKDMIPLLLGIALLMVLLWVLSAAAGLLFWGVLATLIGAAAIGLVRGWLRERSARKAPGRLEQRRAEKEANRLLRDLERQVHRIEKQEQAGVAGQERLAPGHDDG